MRRAAILVTTLVALTFAGCNLYVDDDKGKDRPQSGGGAPDAGCGDGSDHPDGGFLSDAGVGPDGGWLPDGGSWPEPDGGFTPDASPDW